MNKRVIFGIISAVVIMAVAVIIKIYGPTNISHTIVMPSPVRENGENTGEDSIIRAEVNRETVQSALSILKRADSFSRTYKIKTYWDGGESESDFSLWKKGNNIRMSYSEQNTVKNILIIENDLYIWYDDSSSVLHSKLSENNLSKEIDMFSRLVTYEDVLSVPVENILDAGYFEKNEQQCIFVEYKSIDQNYVNQIYVSVDSGLLVSSSRYYGEKLANTMESVSTELSTPPNDFFAAPSKGKA